MIALAADVGEDAGPDAELLPLLDAANVCCGAHAGSPEISDRTVRRCLQLGVAVGAHPGYADRQNFGRVECGLSAAEIEALVVEQVSRLAAVAAPVFVKPHGALYHRCQSDRTAATALVRAAARFGAGVVGQPGFAILEAAESAGVRGLREGYADRGYKPDGSLVERGSPGDILAAAEAAEQALALARSGDIDIICLHGDSPGTLDVARSVRARLAEAGVASGPLTGS